MLAPASFPLEKIRGCFTETTVKNRFEYADAEPNQFNMPHVIFLTGGLTRYANVKKTVAHIVVDENDDGTGKIEHWSIKHTWRR